MAVFISDRPVPHEVARLVSASRSLRSLCSDEETPGLLTVLEAANLAAAARDAHEFDIIHCHTDAYHLAALGGGGAWWVCQPLRRLTTAGRTASTRLRLVGSLDVYLSV